MGNQPRYHISDDGVARACKAVHRCPYGDLETEHYGSPEEARAAYEHSMSENQLRPGVTRQASALRKTALTAPVLDKNFGLNESKKALVAVQQARAGYVTREHKSELTAAFSSAGAKNLMAELFS